MKTVCVMDSVSRANGGIFEAERKLQQSLCAQTAIEVEVLGLRDPHTDADHAAWHPLPPVTLPVRGPSAFGYAPGFSEALTRIDADLAYSVGLWKFPSLAVLRWALRTRRPYLVAPHGMLDPWALRNSGVKKKVAAWLFQNAQLRRATCLRALCASEAESMRAYGLTNPICIIPNGIDLPDETLSAAPRPALFPVDKKVLLYLGRLHPKKGLVPLLAAWSESRAQGPDWLLAIAGWDQSGHEAELKQQAAALGIADSVRFLGPQFGAAKDTCYRACDAFVLPSFSEGLPMVVLEAWAHAKPVLMTPACNLPEGFLHHAALSAEPTAESLASGLRQLFALSTGDLQIMGGQGRALVQKRFAWPKLSGEMASVYRWMLGTGSRPACVDGN
jgi:glycosyltransferase involved in cell wall biosynthesis